MKTKLEWYYSTPDKEDADLHRVQYDSLFDFYNNRGHEVDLREWEDTNENNVTYYRFHLVVYDFRD